MENKKIIYYMNQFFGQLGGEDTADYPPEYREGVVGPAMGFQGELGKLGSDVKVTGTIICGDNYFNEHNDETMEFLEKFYEEHKPDIVIAGPAFNAGRYGMACAGVAEFFDEKGVPVVSGMYEENPGLDITKQHAYTVATPDIASGMREALPKMAKIAYKILRGEEVKPSVDDYFAQGKRLTVFAEERGSKRAVDMLMARFKGEDFTTELPMPEFDKVDIAPAIADLSKATIALVTTGGIVPNGNPDRLQSASAQQWNKYDVSGIDELKGEYYTVHGGFDPVYCNEDADRVAPLDELKKMEKEGKIGGVYQYFYTTTGTGTAVENSVQFGEEIGKELKEAGVDGVILTST